MSKRQVRGGATTSSPKVAATTNNNYDEDEKYQKLSTEAVYSIQACYRTCFAAVFADVIITIIDDDIWSKFFSTDDNSPSLSWVDYVAFFDSVGLAAFGFGLWRISQFYIIAVQVNESKQKRIKDEHFLTLLRTMALAWGIIALNYAFVAVSMAATLPTHGRDGPLDFLLSEVSSSKAALIAVGTLAVGGITIGAYCQKTAYSEDLADNKRISIHQQKSKSNLLFASSRKLGYQAYRNQALCSLTFGFTAIMELLKWVVDADSGIVGRLLSISDVVAPFVITWLLFSLNKSFLRAAIARLRDDGSNTIDDEMYNNLSIAQTGFYKKVSETMKDATIFRLLPYIVRPFGPKILSTLEEIAPSFAAKIVEVLDIFT